MFPVEEEAAVVNFTAEVDGRTIKTQVKKKQEARAEYDKAMEVGPLCNRLSFLSLFFFHYNSMSSKICIFIFSTKILA